MYAYIKGTLAEATPSQVVVEANGMGYRIAIPASCFHALPQIQKQIQLYTSLVIRENFQGLYGFLSHQERDLFEVLTTVSGIGPKTALSLIGHLPLAEFRSAVSQKNILQISKVPGIGKKTAERLIIEMRDKLPHLFPDGSQVTSIPIPEDVHVQDALSALMNLGYKQVAAQKAIEKTLKESEIEIDLASLITKALKHV